MTFRTVSQAEYGQAFIAAQNSSRKIKLATSPWHEVQAGLGEFDQYFLGAGGMLGFIIKQGGELVAVFSLAKGMGDAIMKAAIANGATHLDCFEGYLTDFYKRHGFCSYKIVPNWTKGEPSVHFMKLAGVAMVTLGVETGEVMIIGATPAMV